MDAVTVLHAATIAGGLAIACEIIASQTGRRPAAFLLLKPLTTLLIAASMFTPSMTPPPPLLAAAFGFAVIGDIALMFDGKRAFLAGLGAFFVAHLAFVAVFMSDAAGWRLPLWSLGFVAYATGFFLWLLPRTGELRIPTLAYGAVLTAMVLAAVAADASMQSAASRLALVGALFFALSDSALAVRQFAGPYRGAQPLILSSYWIAIALIALSRWPAPATHL